MTIGLPDLMRRLGRVGRERIRAVCETCWHEPVRVSLNRFFSVSKMDVLG